MKTIVCFAFLLFLALGGPAWAQTADTVLVNGKVVTVDAKSTIAQALAIREGKVMAVGSTAEIRKLAGTATRVIDLQGRTVVPGLIDSHLHGIRAGLSFATEVNWVGVASLTEALGRIREAARTMKPGAWLIVAGGWNEQQMAEKRRPTQAELEAAAGNNPVYVQLGYTWAMLTPAAHKALGLTPDSVLPADGRFEKDASGKLTGAIVGAQAAIVAMFDKLPKPTFEQQVEGTKKFFTELNRLGITGFVDPGGNNLLPPDYQAVFKVWQQREMSVRVAYALNGQVGGKEFDEFKDLTQLMPMGFGDEWLRFNGLGERVTFAMYNNDRPSDADKAPFYDILKWAAGRGQSVTVHWTRDESVNELLTLFERVNREVGITKLRWSIAHLNNASEASLARMKALNVGWTAQPNRVVPPVETAKQMGVVVGAGTDAHRVASYNPFTALQGFLEGNSPITRADALMFYTRGSAWFSFDEDRRGSLEVGKFADLAVLSKDYMTVPVDQIGTIESVLTMVGGKVVYGK